MAPSARPASIIRSTQPHLTRANGHVGTAALLASAVRITTGTTVKLTPLPWMDEAWTHYDECGELNAVVEATANLMSRVNIIAALRPEREGDEPQAVNLDEHPELKRQVELVEEIAGGPSRQGVMLHDMTMQLSVVGLGYIYAEADLKDRYKPWVVLSSDEARTTTSGEVEVQGEDGKWNVIGDHDLLIKLWDHHPRRRSEARSQVRANFRTLRRIASLDDRFIAESDSRLAGNGLLVMPMEVDFPPGQPGVTPGAETEGDEFIVAFIQSAETAYADRKSPSARIPLIAKVPGEFVKDVAHIKFSSDLSDALDTLRTNALRTLAVGLDVPPEQMLGMGDVNHWTGWLLTEQGISMHIEPRASRIMGDLTEEYLKPACRGENIDAEKVIVWYDTSDLETRPDVTGSALEAHQRLLISDETLLGYIGLDAGDYLQPTSPEFKRRVLLQVAAGAPTLAPAMLAEAGILPKAIAQAADDAAPGAPADGGDTGDGAAPDTAPANSPPEQPTDDGGDAQAASAVLAAADQIVERALERAGAKLRNAAASRGKGVPAAGPDAEMHCRVSATELASLDALLVGAWVKVAGIASRYGIDPESLTVCLDTYTRALLASQLPHSFDRLAGALGVVHDRQLIPA